MAFPGDFNRRVALTINHLLVPGDLTDFPLVVTDASLPAEIWTGANAAQPDGGDLRFSSDSAGSTRLACEIVIWDVVNRRAEIHVKRPTVSSVSDDVIYLWYAADGLQSQPAANAAFGSQAVWDADFIGVYHMGGGFGDSTANALNPTAYNPTRVRRGKVGDCGEFFQGYLSLGTGAATQLTALSVELWGKAWVSSGDYAFASNLVHDTGRRGFEVYLTGGTAKLRVASTTAAQTLNLTAIDFKGDSGHFVAFTADGSNLRSYADGAATDTAAQTVTPAYTTALPLLIGATNKQADSRVSNYLWGLLDEVRISRIARSGNWIRASQNNQSSPATFFTTGSPAAANANARSYVSEAAIPANHGAGTLTLHLVGSGTSWTSGTTFTASGVSGWAVSAKTVVDATHATLTLTCPTASAAAGSTGNLRISDGTRAAMVPVVTPKLAVSVSRGAQGSTYTLALAGTGTLWTAETASGLFTASSGTLGTPAASADGAATASLLVDDDAILTDASTGATAPFTLAPDPPALTTSGASYLRRYEGDTVSGVPDGAAVASWLDAANSKTLTGNALVGGGPVYRAKAWPGGRPCVEFDKDAGHWFSAASAADWAFLSDGTAWTAFVVWRTLERDVQARYGGNTASQFWLLATADDDSNRKGFALFYDDATATRNRVQAYLMKGVSGQVPISFASSAAAQPPRAVHCLNVKWDGSTMSFADWDTSLGSASIGSAVVTGSPSFALQIGRQPQNQRSYLSGQIAAVLFIQGALNSADMGAVLAYLEAKYHPAANHAKELWLDSSSVYASSGVTRAAASLTKNPTNPIFDTTGDPATTWDHDKTYFTLEKFGDADYRLWYGVSDDPAPFDVGVAYAISTDGLTWTRPVLGQVSYGGNSNNNLLHAEDDYGGFVFYDASHDPPFFLTLEAWNDGSAVSGVRALGSDDGITWAVESTVFTASGIALDPAYPAGGFYREAKALAGRADGRWCFFYSCNHSADLRHVGLFVSDTSDLTGQWFDRGAVLLATASTAQYYSIGIHEYEQFWIGFVLRFNSTSQNLTQDLWVSLDEGLTWSQVQAAWVPFGSGGSWDSRFMVSADLVQVGSDWRVYYTAGDQGHDTLGTINTQLGYATVRFEGLMSVSGTGTITSRAAYQPGRALSLNVSSGSVTAALIDPATGAAISGYGHADCTPVSTDTLGRAVLWGGLELPNRLFRVQFQLTSAALRSFALAEATPPGMPPVSLLTTGGYDLITVTSASTAGTYDVAGYRLYAGDSPGGEGAVAVATLTAPGTFAAQRSAPAGAAKYYVVRAVDAAGLFSDPSDELAAATEALAGECAGPADVIRRLLIQLSLGSDPPATPWPVYVGKEPGKPDNVITVRTTEGTDDGRDMISGEVWGHPGFQVRVRASDYVTGRRKAGAIAEAFAVGVYQTTVAVGDCRFLVHAVTRIGDVLDLGAETPNSQREVFTLNATCAIRDITP